MAAGKECGLDELLELIKASVYADRVDAEFVFPYDMGGAVSYLMENATVLAREYREEGVWLKISCSKGIVDKYEMYCVSGR